MTEAYLKFRETYFKSIVFLILYVFCYQIQGLPFDEKFGWSSDREFGDQFGVYFGRIFELVGPRGLRKRLPVFQSQLIGDHLEEIVKTAKSRN